MSESPKLTDKSNELELASSEIDPRILEVVRKEAELVSYAVVHQETHSGPMPSPKQLLEYESALPGLASEIRDEFLANGKHVRELEKAALEAHKGDNEQNQKVAERLVWGALLAAILLAILGHDWVAGTIAVSTVGAVITGFLKQRAALASRKEEGRSKVDE